MPDKEDSEKTDCDHAYEYGGVRYRDGSQISGSSARYRSYFDLYFCSKCLHQVPRRLEATGNSYQDIKFGATPL